MTRQFGVIFDVDGVLVDSYRAHLESWQAVAEHHGLVLTEQDFARTFGMTSRAIIERVWPGQFDDARSAAFDELKEADYRRRVDTRFPEMAGASGLILSLHEAGFALAIGSSGPPENVALVQRKLLHGDLISAMVNGRDVTRGKPDPEVFLLAAARLGLPPDRCAVIEDAPVGLQAARRAGMVAIALTGTADRAALEGSAHLIVERLSDLTPLAIVALIANRSPGPRA